MTTIYKARILKKFLNLNNLWYISVTKLYSHDGTPCKNKNSEWCYIDLLDETGTSAGTFTITTKENKQCTAVFSLNNCEIYDLTPDHKLTLNICKLLVNKIKTKQIVEATDIPASLFFEDIYISNRFKRINLNISWEELAIKNDLEGNI